jgi:hypothetical protein
VVVVVDVTFLSGLTGALLRAGECIRKVSL